MISPEEQQTLRDINDQHLAGKTSDAAREARQRLGAVDTKDFTDVRITDLHAERATQALVLTTSEIHGFLHMVQAFPHLIEIARIIDEHYPLAKEEVERQKREVYWREGFAGRNGYIIALRDMYRSFRLLAVILHDPALMALTERIKKKVSQFAREYPEDHEALQFFIQEGTYEEAARALRTYEQKYASGNPKEAIILTAHVLAKAMEASTPASWKETLSLFGHLVSQAQQDPKGLGKFVAREIAKKLGNQILKMQENHWKHLHGELAHNRDAYDTSQIEILGKLRV